MKNKFRLYDKYISRLAFIYFKNRKITVSDIALVLHGIQVSDLMLFHRYTLNKLNGINNASNEQKAYENFNETLDFHKSLAEALTSIIETIPQQ